MQQGILATNTSQDSPIQVTNMRRRRQISKCRHGRGAKQRAKPLRCTRGIPALMSSFVIPGANCAHLPNSHPTPAFNSQRSADRRESQLDNSTASSFPGPSGRQGRESIVGNRHIPARFFTVLFSQPISKLSQP
ncbi:hypothetical protein K456DRAFT_588478 [Colletotrichum gloeosporioides 23]|nr:hypothetical protein K456DRAFT_588478 [Colletotrichum gloeosporioides 23]